MAITYNTFTILITRLFISELSGNKRTLALALALASFNARFNVTDFNRCFHIYVLLANSLNFQPSLTFIISMVIVVVVLFILNLDECKIENSLD